MKYLLFCLFVLFAACSENKNSDIVKVKLRELDNEPIDLTQYQGRTVFINFWATWCKPCLQEMPSIERAREQLSNSNIIFLFASNEDVNQINQFIESRSFDFHFVQLDNMEALNIQALPTTFIFDLNGTLKYSESGFRKWDDPNSIELIAKIMNDEK